MSAEPSIIQWNNANRRILFVSKDPDENKDTDIRCFDLTHNPVDGNLSFKKNRFVKNLLRINAGLNSITSEYFPPIEDVNDIAYLDKIWDDSAVARINVKKHGGGPHISYSQLKEVLSKENPYVKLIVEQLNLLDANIIVCCGGSGIIKEFVISHCYPDAEQVNNSRIYFSPNQNVWIIDSYHMNPIGAISDERLYMGMMHNFQEALIKIGKEEPVR